VTDNNARVAERMLSVNGVALCAEAFGDAADPTVLLVMGSSGSMDWWETEFCERLAAGSRHVVRYDMRDTGRSTAYEAGAPSYTGDDLVADLIGVLDAYGVERGHLVGESMGGALAQVAALEHPERVASLTLIATSPAGPASDLPGMSDEAMARFGAIATPDWSDRDAVLEYIVASARACASPREPFDEAAARELAETVFERSVDIEASYANHHRIEGGDPWRHRLGELAAPTLVIHGTDDPVFPLGHGEALANEITGAELLVLDGVGHEHPRRAWDRIVPAVLAHTAG
jgi:pimeloyl-ACP methyl ester carboxylesterase